MAADHPLRHRYRFPFFSQTELTDEVVDIIDAEIIGERIVVRVARNYERLVQIHDTVTTSLPVPKRCVLPGRLKYPGSTMAF